MQNIHQTLTSVIRNVSIKVSNQLTSFVQRDAGVLVCALLHVLTAAGVIRTFVTAKSQTCRRRIKTRIKHIKKEKQGNNCKTIHNKHWVKCGSEKPFNQSAKQETMTVLENLRRKFESREEQNYNSVSLSDPVFYYKSVAGTCVAVNVT